MAFINNYWRNKEKNKLKAIKQTKEFESVYKDEINKCVNNTKLYNYDFVDKTVKEDKLCNIIIDDIDSINAIFKYSEGKTCVLNFSSYKEAGGMFLRGSMAQEESLCHKSFLYNVLSRFTDTFYKWNLKHKNKALYLNRALYVPDMTFFRQGEEIKCDVLVCAAPNKRAAQKYCSVTNNENYAILKNRIKYIFNIAKYNKVDTLILGAYGCGVFGQTPDEVANIFKEYLLTDYKCFSKILFAIPDKNSVNYKEFVKVLN